MTTSGTTRAAPERVASRGSSAGGPVPGLVLTGAGVAASWLLAELLPVAGLLTWSVLLGALAANTGLVPASTGPGVRWATRVLLRVGIVLLGLQLAVPQVVALGPALIAFVVACVVLTFLGTLWLGRRLGLPPGTSLMVATGFSICGAAAIAAMDGVTDADEEDVATGVALVTLCGTLAILVLPGLGTALHLTPRQYGFWVGAGVHEVAQVVAAAAPVAGALAVAVVVKLARVVLLAPMVAWQALRTRGRAVAPGRRPPLVPLFVVGFLLAALLRSTVPLPTALLDGAQVLQDVALAAALFGLGTGVRLDALRRTGSRALALGAGSWLLVGALSLGGAVALG